MLACSKIRHIVKLRQMLRRWRRKAAGAATRSRSRVPSDVPAGHVAVTVGTTRRRFVVRATYLNHPIFSKLLSLAEEEYGFAAAAGPLAIPCDEAVFEEIIRFMAARSDPSKIAAARFEDFQRHCHVGIRNGLELFPESRPLLRGENSTW